MRAHEAGSHKGKWEAFTSKVLEEVTQGGKGVVVMAWGAWAQKCAAKVDTKKHLVLSSVVRPVPFFSIPLHIFTSLREIAGTELTRNA